MDPCLLQTGQGQLRVILLTDVFIFKLVTQTHSLRLVLYTLAVYDGCLELFDNSSVDGIALSHMLVPLDET